MFSGEYNSTTLEEGIAEKGEVMVCTSGYSMWPMLRNRKDMVVVEKVTRPLKVHDVPVYRAPSGKVIMHRIIKVKPDGQFVIRGDNLFCKEYYGPDDIIAVLREFYRGGKRYVCATSKAYKIYIFYVRSTYIIRFALYKIRCLLSKIPFLKKLKKAIFSKKK